MFFSATSGLIVQFNQPLQPAIVDAPNWTCVADGLNWTGFDANTVGPSVFAAMASSTVNLDPPTVSFSPPPFDVIGGTGLPAVAFSDFPMTVIP